MGRLIDADVAFKMCKEYAYKDLPYKNWKTLFDSIPTAYPEKCEKEEKIDKCAQSYTDEDESYSKDPCDGCLAGFFGQCAGCEHDSIDVGL